MRSRGSAGPSGTLKNAANSTVSSGTYLCDTTFTSLPAGTYTLRFTSAASLTGGYTFVLG